MSGPAAPRPLGQIFNPARERCSTRKLIEREARTYREMGMTYWLEQAEAETRELM